MTVHRDYGNFSKTASRLLKPLVSQHGYSQFAGASFSRNRQEWLEGFFLQQTQWGGGHFWVNIGIDVPGLNDLWLNSSAKSFGLLIGERLDNQGVDHGAAPYPASNAAELDASIKQVVEDLPSAESWFAQFRSLSDVAERYRYVNNVMPIGNNNQNACIGVLNYGFLLLLSSRITEAKEWLQEAYGLSKQVVSDDEARFKKRRPGKEALQYHEFNLQRLRAAESALRNLEP